MNNRNGRDVEIVIQTILVWIGLVLNTSCTPIAGQSLLCADGKTTGCVETDKKFIQFSNITGNGRCTNILYPRNQNTGLVAESSLMAVTLAKESSCVNIFDKDNCQGGYFQFDKSNFDENGHLLLPFFKDNILENFPIRPRSIESVNCFVRPNLGSRNVNPNDVCLAPGFRIGLKAILDYYRTQETSQHNHTIGKLCDTYDFGEGTGNHRLKYYHINLTVEHYGNRSISSCVELFEGVQCNLHSVRRFIRNLSPGESFKLWRFYPYRYSPNCDLRRPFINLWNGKRPRVYGIQSHRLCSTDVVRYSRRSTATDGGGGVGVAIIVDKFIVKRFDNLF